MTWFRAGGGGGEDVSEEVAVQTPLIQQIREAIVGKATEANATAEHIEVGYSAYVGQVLIDGTLDPETIKNGQYVWKKYEIDKSTEILNPKFTADFVPSRDPNLKIINKNFGMPTEATYIDFFNGFKDSSGRVFAKDGDRLKTPWGYVYTYYETQNAMHLNTTSGTEQPTEFTFTGTKQITTNEQMKNYIGYVVSDNESAYPDGGEQDGYWYENALKTPEQIIAPLFGMSKASFGTMMLSSHQTTQHDLVHNLGAIPKLVFLFTPEHLYALPNYIKSATIVDGYTQYDGYGTNYYFMNYLVQSSSNSSEEAFSNLDSAVPVSRATTTTIPLGDSDFIYFAQGRTYYWVAMA